MDDGSLSPRDRFSIIERRQDALGKQMEAIESKLDRILGAIALIGFGMPILLFVLEKVLETPR